MALKALNIKFTPSQVNTTDSKGNTALFYATKHKNMDFIDYLLAMKADVNIRCSKVQLHFIMHLKVVIMQ